MAYLPFADVNINLITIFLAGLTVGILKGTFGTLANIVIVPVLNIFGLPLSISVSTSAGYSFGRSSLSLFNNNPEWPALRRVGMVAGIAGLPGVFLGFKIHMLTMETFLGSKLLLLIYFTLLLFAVIALIRQWSFFNRHHYYDDAPFPAFGLGWRFPLAVPGGSGLKHITLCRVALTGFLLGTATGFLGLGAGILGVPLFMYILGIPQRNALPTDTVSMLLISSGTFLCYTAVGQVELAPVIILIVAVGLGNGIGALMPGEINLGHARMAFAILLGAIALSTAASINSLISSRIILYVAGSSLFVILIVFSLIPDIILTLEKRVARHKNTL